MPPGRIPKKYPWIPAPAEAGQGDIPKPPPNLLAASKKTWDLWFTSWWSGHWTEADVPGLRQTIKLFDEVERGLPGRTELRAAMKSYGLNPEGRQSLRWEPPAPAKSDEDTKNDELTKRRNERKARLA